MADETGTGTSTEIAGGTGLNPNPSLNTGSEAGSTNLETQGDGSGKPRKQSFTAEEMAEAKAEAAKRRLELRAREAENQTLKEQLKKIEEARLAEEGKWKELAERAQVENASLKKEMHEKITRAEIRNYAIAEGLIDPDIASLIVLPKEDTADLQALVKAHKEAKPHLYKQPSTGQIEKKPTQGEPSKPTPVTGTSGDGMDVSKLSPAEYRTYKATMLARLRQRS